MGHVRFMIAACRVLDPRPKQLHNGERPGVSICWGEQKFPLCVDTGEKQFLPQKKSTTKKLTAPWLPESWKSRNCNCNKSMPCPSAKKRNRARFECTKRGDRGRGEERGQQAGHCSEGWVLGGWSLRALGLVLGGEQGTMRPGRTRFLRFPKVCGFPPALAAGLRSACSPDHSGEKVGAEKYARHKGIATIASRSHVRRDSI